jgi:putative spermidine/putrescine transport system substrate-binding protein
LGDRVATLPAPWSQVGIRQGQIWAVPWSWGVAAIAYDRRKVSTPITDWSDLWRPDLRGKLTLPDHPRDTIGLVLKSLGQSYNASAIEPSPALRKALARLNEQALFYTSSDYLQVLEIGDSWVAVGWTSDLYQLQELNANVEIVIPKSGTALWWDAWVLPRHRNPTLESGESSSEWKALTAQWFDLLLDPETAETVVSLSHTPLVVPTPAEHLPRQIRDRALFNAAVLDRSEVLNPLPEPEAIAYLDLWRRMRTETL